MIARSLFRIFQSNGPNSALVQSRKKHFTRDGYPPDIKFHNILKLYSVFVNSFSESSRVKSINAFSCGLPRMCEGRGVFDILKRGILRIPLNLKEHSVQVVKMCTRQCECVIAHRIRRGHQMFCLYTKMWDEAALRTLVSKFKKQFARRGKEMLFGAVGVSVYNWEKMKISDIEMLSFFQDIDIVYKLRESTITCSKCKHRTIIDVQAPNIDYCMCSQKENNCSDENNWIPFLERKDIIVWRKEDPHYRGLFAYKVYGSYDDVTAYDFLCVQLDTEYRKEWDRTAAELTILDSDPFSNSDIIYWVMKWPRMFSNRDYVFNRRYKIDEKENIMVVVNKCTEHPQCPESKENIRVKEYWSSMVIRPHKHFTEPGIEYCLTYFDDPGVSIPSAITSWVAVSGLPDFLMRVREAARQLAIRRKSSQYKWIPKPEPMPLPAPVVESEDSPGPTANLPSDTTSKTPFASPLFPHQDSQDSYLQLSTSRLFL